MNIEKRILFEDNHLLVINKPAGLLVQGDRTGDVTLIDLAKAYIKRVKNKPGAVYVGLPHRVDRPVSGTVILCKTSKALTRMTKIFKERAIEKTYLAVVHGIPEPSGVCIDQIAQNQRGKKSFVVDKPIEGSKRGELRYSMTYSKGSEYALLEVKPLTGRKHQIRVQLSHLGHPIAGDLKYGSHLRLGHRICLHAWRVQFVHPVTRHDMGISSPIPKEVEWDFGTSL